MLPMMSRRSVLSGSLAFAGSHGIRVAPSQAAVSSSGPPNGSLLIVGGGHGVDIQDSLIRLSRGEGGVRTRWVYIPTAMTDEELRRDKPPGFAVGDMVTVLHTRDRGEADSAAFVLPLQSATAVYFAGGRQWRLVDAYAGTRTERELRAVLDRGGLISGTSAGATIQGSYLIRGAPEGNQILMSPGHERGFGYITNVAIDQHVLVRRRERDLAKVIAVHRELLGIGIDEGTAVIVRQNRMTVIGRSVVLITDGATHDGEPYYTLTRGTQFDLATRTVVRA
jgi:cyanophycinase